MRHDIARSLLILLLVGQGFTLEMATAIVDGEE